MLHVKGYKCHNSPAPPADASAKAKPHPENRSSEFPHKTIHSEFAPESSVTKHNRVNNRDFDRKHNIAIHGIAECQKALLVITVLTWMNNPLLKCSLPLCLVGFALQIKEDCYQLRKYNESNRHPRPLLIWLNHARDVSQILAKRGSLCPPSIQIKPDHSPDKWTSLSLLL